MTTVRTATFGPVGWTPWTGAEGRPGPAAYVKELLPGDESGGVGDTFALWRLAAGGAAVTVEGAADTRYLVLSGALDVALTDPADPVQGENPVRRHRGDYLAVPEGRGATFASPDGALLLRLDGARPGDPVLDAFGPAGWWQVEPGQWARLLLEIPADGSFDERVVGLAYTEPGGGSARHPHPTAHRFLYLEGEADDEVVFADGRRETARRRAGDFVDYPVGVEHRSSSVGGCLLLFAHEPLAGGRPA